MAIYICDCPFCHERFIKDIGADLGLRKNDILSSEDFHELCISGDIFVKEVSDNKMFLEWQEQNA